MKNIICPLDVCVCVGLHVLYLSVCVCVCAHLFLLLSLSFSLSLSLSVHPTLCQFVILLQVAEPLSGGGDGVALVLSDVLFAC